nr:uncharacterized protein LOC105847450 [Hydra vulgaris]
MKYKEEVLLEAINSVISSPKMSVRAAAKFFKVPRATLQSRINGKVEIGAKAERKSLMSLDLKKKLLDFADNRARMGIGFGKEQFLVYAGKLAKKYGNSFKNGKPSNKWWRLLNNRHNKKVTLRQPESTASVRHQCMNLIKVANYFTALKEVIKDCQPEVIWNMDETGLQLDFKAHKIVAAKGTKYLHMRTSGNQEMITLIVCVNAAGRALPPHVIPKRKTVKSLQSFQVLDAPEGTNWSPSESGWTKQGIAKLWFELTFLKNIGPQRPQVLILDGHDSHNFVELIDMAIQNRIEIVELPAHTSNWLQPCVRTVFKPFKVSYNKAAQDMMSNHPGVIINKANFTGLLTKAWNKSMTKANIESGFKSCGIFPYNPSIIPAEAYLPNYVYSEDRLMTNLFDQIKIVDNTTIVKQIKQTTDSTKVLLPDIELEQHLITNPRFAVANDHDYLAEPITVVEHRSDDLVELNMKTIELKAASNKATSKLQDSFRIMSYSEIEQPIDQHEVDFTVSTLLASDFAKTRSFAPNFPFKNSSYPGDGDNDILPYSYPNFTKSKKAKNADKFFVLTSKEAYESQLNQKQKQAQNEKEKEMRKLKRLQNLKIKEATVLSKDNPRKKPSL